MTENKGLNIRKAKQKLEQTTLGEIRPIYFGQFNDKLPVGLRIATPFDRVELADKGYTSMERDIMFEKYVLIIPPNEGEQYKMIFTGNSAYGKSDLPKFEANQRKELEMSPSTIKGRGGYIHKGKLEGKSFTFETKWRESFAYGEIFLSHLGKMAEYILDTSDMNYHYPKNRVINSVLNHIKELYGAEILEKDPTLRKKSFRITIPEINSQQKKPFMRPIVGDDQNPLQFYAPHQIV